MLSLSYFSYQDKSNSPLNRCNLKSDRLPLAVNCAGTTVTSEEYETHNAEGRVDYFLLYVISGTLLVEKEHTDVACGAGTFIIFPPGWRYKYHHKAGELIECFWLHFSGSDAERALEQYGFGIFPEINSVTHDKVISARYQHIFDTFVQNDRFRDRELSILLDRLLLSLAKRTASSPKVKNMLSRSISWINENYNSNIYISDLAAMENFSLSRYNSLFRQITGMSPSGYIKQLRINAACELLISTDLPINVIGNTVGYPNQCFFSKIFAKTVGMTPTEYRENK